MLLMQGRLIDALVKLPRRERDLLAAHYGLEAGQGPMSLSQIAQRMGITKARVRQLEVRALGRLRLMLEEQIDRQAAEVIGQSGRTQKAQATDAPSDFVAAHNAPSV
jgi:DNA-directed RNA polymerase sigma subunit (sigma70/sigma32)